jgi:hypothetical protein
MTPTTRPRRNAVRSICLLLSAVFAASMPSPPVTLHELAKKYRTDKSMLGHGYVNTYAMLFDPLRHTVRNITEVGVFNGNSLPMWADYFADARIWGIDIKVSEAARSFTKAWDRIHIFQGSSQDPETPARLRLEPNTMDLVIDDGDHSWQGNKLTIEAMWPLVKPGGFYIIEDVATGSDRRGKYDGKRSPGGFAKVAHNVTGFMRGIYLNNDVFFTDAMVGIDFYKSAFARKEVMKHWMEDPVNHNSHLVVIRKRAAAAASSGGG